jgi:hypothetical protein
MLETEVRHLGTGGSKLDGDLIFLLLWLYYTYNFPVAFVGLSAYTNEVFMVDSDAALRVVFEKLANAGIREHEYSAFVAKAKSVLQLGGVGSITLERLVKFILTNYPDNWSKKFDGLIERYKDQTL